MGLCVCMCVYYSIFEKIKKISCSPSWPQVHYIADDDLELPNLLLLPLKC